MTTHDLLDHMRTVLRSQHTNAHTEKEYLELAKAYLDFNHGHEPHQLARSDLDAFMTHIGKHQFGSNANQGHVLDALTVLYRDVIGDTPSWLVKAVKDHAFLEAQNVLSPEECQRLLSHLFSHNWLIGALIYGSGLRLSECVRLRIGDIDMDEYRVQVRRSNGQRKRMTMLPRSIRRPLEAHLENLKMLHIKDIADGYGEVYLPPKISEATPHLARSWEWQYLFPTSQRVVKSSQSSAPQRHHIEERNVQTSIERAAIDADIFKHSSADTLRNSFAVHLFQSGVNLKTVQALLGHGEAAGIGEVTLLSNDKMLSPLDLLTSH